MRGRRQLLAILQLGDSGLPIGRFAHSYGFEELLSRQPAMHDNQLTEHLRHFLRFSVGPLDGRALLDAHAAARDASLGDIIEVDRAVTHHKITPASRMSSTTSGRSLARLGSTCLPAGEVAGLSAAVEDGLCDGNLAVVEGVFAAELGIEAIDALLMELRGSAASCLGACVRLGRIGAMHAQQILLELHNFLYSTAETVQRAPIGRYASASPLFDVLSYRHARRSLRTFAS